MPPSRPASLPSLASTGCGHGGWTEQLAQEDCLLREQILPLVSRAAYWHEATSSRLVTALERAFARPVGQRSVHQTQTLQRLARLRSQQHGGDAMGSSSASLVDTTHYEMLAQDCAAKVLRGEVARCSLHRLDYDATAPHNSSPLSLSPRTCHRASATGAGESADECLVGATSTGLADVPGVRARAGCATAFDTAVELGSITGEAPVARLERERACAAGMATCERELRKGQVRAASDLGAIAAIAQTPSTAAVVLSRAPASSTVPQLPRTAPPGPSSTFEDHAVDVASAAPGAPVAGAAAVACLHDSSLAESTLPNAPIERFAFPAALPPPPPPPPPLPPPPPPPPQPPPQLPSEPAAACAATIDAQAMRSSTDIMVAPSIAPSMCAISTAEVLERDPPRSDEIARDPPRSDVLARDPPRSDEIARDPPRSDVLARDLARSDEIARMRRGRREIDADQLAPSAASGFLPARGVHEAHQHHPGAAQMQAAHGGSCAAEARALVATDEAGVASSDGAGMAAGEAGTSDVAEEPGAGVEGVGMEEARLLIERAWLEGTAAEESAERARTTEAARLEAFHAQERARLAAACEAAEARHEQEISAAVRCHRLELTSALERLEAEIRAREAAVEASEEQWTTQLAAAAKEHQLELRALREKHQSDLRVQRTALETLEQTRALQLEAAARELTATSQKHAAEMTAQASLLEAESARRAEAAEEAARKHQAAVDAFCGKHAEALASHSGALEAAEARRVQELAAAEKEHRGALRAALEARSAMMQSTTEEWHSERAVAEQRHADEMRAAQERHAAEQEAAQATHTSAMETAQTSFAAQLAAAEERYTRLQARRVSELRDAEARRLSEATAAEEERARLDRALRELQSRADDMAAQVERLEVLLQSTNEDHTHLMAQAEARRQAELSIATVGARKQLRQAQLAKALSRASLHHRLEAEKQRHAAEVCELTETLVPQVEAAERRRIADLVAADEARQAALEALRQQHAEEIKALMAEHVEALGHEREKYRKLKLGGDWAGTSKGSGSWYRAAPRPPT